jgi:hypothetical protein
MKKFTIASVAAAGLSAAVLGLAAPAIAAPTAPDNAQQTISQLEAQGNRVIVNRQSGATLSDASVVSVRPGPEIRDWVTVQGRQGDDRNHTDRVLQTVGRVYYVDVK